MVLNMVFDYASTTVRPNAVRALHSLVECVSNVNPEKALRKFLPFCVHNIRTEIENGASSVRTTSSSAPLPSDATLHWSECLDVGNLPLLIGGDRYRYLARMRL
jgi:proteasome activator subunit 4